MDTHSISVHQQHKLHNEEREKRWEGKRAGGRKGERERGEGEKEQEGESKREKKTNCINPT